MVGSVFSQNIADMWIAMPDSFAPYLTKNDRKEMVECLRIGVDTSVQNKFRTTTNVQELSDDYGSFKLSESRDIQILRLPTNSDSIYCVIENHYLPETSSEIMFFDKEWHELPAEGKLTALNAKDFISKPDTMAISRFEETSKLISLSFVEYAYDSQATVLTAVPNFLFTSEEEKKQIEVIVRKRKLKWNKEMFLDVNY